MAESYVGHPRGKNKLCGRVRFVLLLWMSLLPYMETCFSSPDFVWTVLQPVIHLFYTGYLKTVVLSKLQLYLHIFYVGYRHVHSQGFLCSRFSGAVLCKEPRTCTDLWAVHGSVHKMCSGSRPVDLGRPRRAEGWLVFLKTLWQHSVCCSLCWTGSWEVVWLECWRSDQEVPLPASVS